MRSPKPFTCATCRRKTDELRYCSKCNALVCFRCIILDKESSELRYALGEWECKKCRKARRG